MIPHDIKGEEDATSKAAVESETIDEVPHISVEQKAATVANASHPQTTKADGKSESMMLLLSALAGALIAAVAGVLTELYVLREQRSVEQLLLVRKLTDNFYENEIFAKIRSSIDQCEPIYFGFGGRYTHDQINRYLGFYEDLGFYSNQKGFIDIDVVSHAFGAHLVEAYSYPEMRKYVTMIQSHQPEAFTEFDTLYERLLEEKPVWAKTVQQLVTVCND